MNVPAPPCHEHSEHVSLRSLHGFTSEPEERFDRLTRLARRTFAVPIALITLVDEIPQTFTSCLGLEVKKTPRDIFFCGHSILGEEVFVIPDTSLEERFAAHPLVVEEPYIHFFAACPIRAIGGSIIGSFCIIDEQPRELPPDDIDTLKDLTSLVEDELLARRLANVDELTGLHNRRGFKMLAKHSLALCVRENFPTALVFLDLNHFKTINDQFGHAEGDRALILFAQHLKNNFRGSDILARLGGDEFVALLPHTSEAEAENIMVKFVTSLETENRNSQRKYTITFSYGITNADNASEHDIDALLAKTDALMYCQKNRRSA